MKKIFFFLFVLLLLCLVACGGSDITTISTTTEATSRTTISETKITLPVSLSPKPTVPTVPTVDKLLWEIGMTTSELYHAASLAGTEIFSIQHYLFDPFQCIGACIVCKDQDGNTVLGEIRYDTDSVQRLTKMEVLSPIEPSLEAFSELRNGMTPEEVIRIMGCPTNSLTCGMESFGYDTKDGQYLECIFNHGELFKTRVN